jgi:DNA adenine methylase
MGISPTILRWAGSKRQLISTIEEYWIASGADRYVEPFAGSACAFFSINPPSALLGDLNGELISTYRTIRSQWQEVYKKVDLFPKTKEFYYDLRKKASQDSDAVSNAARFIYLNRYCFNGLYRTNASGKFNVPYGEKGSIPQRETFRKASYVLRKAELINADFETTLERVRKGDFVYLDPPFSVENTRVFIDYGPEKFSLIDIARLRYEMERIDRIGAKFLVSYLDSQEAELLEPGYKSNRTSVRRSIAGFSSNRRKSDEVLISNF